MTRKSRDEDIDPETYVRENRKLILQIIRSCDDPFTRASAWALLDRNTPNPDIDTLHEELDQVANKDDQR